MKLSQFYIDLSDSDAPQTSLPTLREKEELTVRSARRLRGIESGCRSIRAEENEEGREGGRTTIERFPILQFDQLSNRHQYSFSRPLLAPLDPHDTHENAGEEKGAIGERLGTHHRFSDRAIQQR